MGRPKRLNLLEFLSKPRFLHEIVEHYKVSKETAVFHLSEAMKSGQVLVSEAPVFQTIKDSTGKLKKLGGLLYVYQKSPILVGTGTRLSMLETDNFISELGNSSRISFLLKPNDVLGKATLERGPTSPALVKKANPKNRGAKLRANSSLISKLKAPSVKVTSAKSTTSSRLLSSKQYSNGKLEPLLNVEKIRLFQALLKEPLPSLDIRNRFNVSRQTITRLVKRGLLTETWGSKGVGVRFKLTSKGKACLRQLEEASKYELKIRESPLTRLKQRSVV
jgi:DNA-binding MarR family transcriptional regulator